MTAEAINSRRLGLEGLALKVHIRFFRAFASFTPVTRHASSNQVAPSVWTSLVPRNDMIQRQVTHFTTAILARKIIPAQDLSFRQCNTWTRALDHVAEADHRGNLKLGRATVNHAATVEQRFRLAREYQRQSTFGVTNVYRFKVNVENEYGLIQ